MSIGTNLRRLREERKLTQEQLSEKLGVSFQAVSAWERDEYKPDIDRLIALAGALDVSVSALVEEKSGLFKTRQAIYDWEHMKTFLKTTARNYRLPDTLRAVDYAVEAHEGQKRKKSDIPYICHPLNLACHAVSMGITDDAVLSACLLHDVVEDCGKTLEELPVSDEAKEIVGLLTHLGGKGTEEDRKAYYEAICENPKASLVKCIDRCNNLTTMSWGLSREKIYAYIEETEKYYGMLLKTIKGTVEYGHAAWLLKYQMESMLDIYKRLL